MKPIDAIKAFEWPHEERTNKSGILNDGEWIVATDGHTLCAIELKYFSIPSGLGENISDFVNWRSVIDFHLKGIEIKVSSLSVPDKELTKYKEFKKIPCLNCDGEGYIGDHICNCEYCDVDLDECEACKGFGEIDSNKVESIKYDMREVVSAFGYHFQANLVNRCAYLFRSFGVKSARIGFNEEKGSLQLMANGLILLVMKIVGEEYNTVLNELTND